MFIEIIIGILLGILAGTFTGLIPGIHVNLISLLIVAYIWPYSSNFPATIIIFFILSMSITHTFLSTIPSIFLGAPDAATALSVLPGHKMLLEGKGLEAMKLTIIGSFFGLASGFITYFVATNLLISHYESFTSLIDEILIVASLFIILSNKKIFWAVLVFISSATLGKIVLDSNLENPLFPLLTGFFGIATLLFSIQNVSSIPMQKNGFVEISGKNLFSSGILGSLSGLITGVLPGLGSSTAAAIGSTLKPDKDAKGFLIMIGAISTANFFISIAALHAINKARNGAIIAVKEMFAINEYLLLLLVCIISGGVAGLIAISVSKHFLRFITKINYRKLVIFVIIFLCGMTIILSGMSGFFIMVIAIIIGLVANRKGITKNTMMACILVPVLIYFL